MPTAHIFVAASIDSFIAREDGSIDLLLGRDDPGEDVGIETSSRTLTAASWSAGV